MPFEILWGRMFLIMFVLLATFFALFIGLEMLFKINLDSPVIGGALGGTMAALQPFYVRRRVAVAK